MKWKNQPNIVRFPISTRPPFRVSDCQLFSTPPSVGTIHTVTSACLVGAASKSLYGTCESMYKPDLGPEELFEVISQSLLSSVDRDCISGWGGIVHVVTPDQVITKTLKGRMD